MTTAILGISAYYHDSAAALLVDGGVVAAAQEERFSRRKHDARFPTRAIKSCLTQAGIDLSAVSSVVYYEKPLIKFERLLETYLQLAPRGLGSFVTAMPIWIKEKLFLKSTLRAALAEIGGVGNTVCPKLLFAEHHQSHAASAFYPSPFESAAVLCLDGVGEWATTSAWFGQGRMLTPLWEIRFPHSIGLLYSAFTYHAGFKVNSGEYKLMGLAPYGKPRFVDKIYDRLIDLHDDGSFRLNLDYFEFATGLRMTNQQFSELFDGPPRVAEGSITQREMDLARSIQLVTEDIVLRLARTLQRETGVDALCLAGGVALNCVANGRLIREGPFRSIWIQPASGDAGGALGAAWAGWHHHLERPRTVKHPDRMIGSYLGPAFSPDQVRKELDAHGAVYRELPEEKLIEETAVLIADGAVVGWFQGRMEFGPRALGARSIIGDPRRVDMQSTMNLKIKFRESFRPFAPAVLKDKVSHYFSFDGVSPYMLVVAEIHPNQRLVISQGDNERFGIETLKIQRSKIPAVTHVDFSARIQTVDSETNPRFYRLIETFQARTGCGVLINTSFNVRGEPIVCTPADAYRCFMQTEIDYLVVENFFLAKQDQPAVGQDTGGMSEFELD